jgi:hypothetical protein
MGAPRKVKIALAAAAATAAIAISATAAIANWRDEATDYDINRLQLLEQWRDQALHQVQTYSDSRGDFAVLKSVMEPQGHIVPAKALVGNWRCRNMKMGGVNAFIVYPQWYPCHVSVQNGALFFQKTAGSIRTQGMLYPENGAWIYLGAASTTGEPWHTYSGRHPSLGAAATPDDQIGLLSGIGNNHLRLEIPGPVLESTYDIIELER